MLAILGIATQSARYKKRNNSGILNNRSHGCFSTALRNPHQRSTFVHYEFCEIHCGTPLGFEICCPFQPSVRYATLGFGVELLCSSFQFGLLQSRLLRPEQLPLNNAWFDAFSPILIREPWHASPPPTVLSIFNCLLLRHLWANPFHGFPSLGQEQIVVLAR